MDKNYALLIVNKNIYYSKTIYINIYIYICKSAFFFSFLLRFVCSMTTKQILSFSIFMALFYSIFGFMWLFFWDIFFAFFLIKKNALAFKQPIFQSLLLINCYFICLITNLSLKLANFQQEHFSDLIFLQFGSD